MAYPLEAQVYYIPDESAKDRIVLNRVVSSGGSDHADTMAPCSLSLSSSTEKICKHSEVEVFPCCRAPAGQSGALAGLCWCLGYRRTSRRTNTWLRVFIAADLTEFFSDFSSVRGRTSQLGPANLVTT